MRLETKRIYDPPSPDDGIRILIDRLWPRGISKAAAKLDHWARDVAPSDELRQWYRHEPDKWEQFRSRYFAELDAVPEAVQALRAWLEAGTVTLLFSSRETELNNATALKQYIGRSG